MPTDEKRPKKRSEDATPDLACTRCRERKIRCGRERPQCHNCERDEVATCVYQNPAKRVNHLKLLCDGVDRLQDRLTNIESHLDRLKINGAVDGSGGGVQNSHSSMGRPSISEDDAEDVEEEGYGGTESPDPSDLHVFRNQVDMVDRYHGPSSLFVLCNHFRIRAQAADGVASSAALGDMLQTLCDTAGATELFPAASEAVVQLPPKQQAITAVSHFLQHVDCTTDIFTRENLFANLDRVYAQPVKPGDDAWATCFKAITLLVLSMEISTQANNALFGDFARSCLPSRAALVTSHLLSTPRLINVQTLILLSVAAQHFDPPEWSEYIFSHACMLARTMGLHRTQLLPRDAGADEVEERAKVLQSLYIRDKSLCTTRGAVSWLPSSDSNIGPRPMGAVEHLAPYSNHLRLAMIQDDVYRLAHGTSRNGGGSASGANFPFIEQRLQQYARELDIFDTLSPSSAHLPLEFLTTRILALQQGGDARQVEQARSDARASCFLLLIVHGDQDRRVVDSYKRLTQGSVSSVVRPATAPDSEASMPQLPSIFDAFSVPAFFILLEGLLQAPSPESGNGEPLGDHDLLRRVSARYTKSTARMQADSYHRKVAWTFDQLLAIFDLITNNSTPAPLSAPIADMTPSNPAAPISTFQDPTLTSPTLTPAYMSGDLSAASFWPPPSTVNPTLPWDDWMSGPTSLGTNTSPETATSLDAPGSTSSNLLSQMLGSADVHNLPDGTEDSMQWLAATPDSSHSRKRPRTEESESKKNDSNSLSEFLVSSQETPFYLISG